MNTLRLVGDYVVPSDGTDRVIAGGVIDIDAAGRISAVGNEHELDGTPDEVMRIGGLLMPGLVNAHAHGPMTLLRSAGDGLPLMEWLTQAVWPREGKMQPEDALVGMTLASVEMLLAGVTTSVEMYLFEEQVAEAILATGARAQVMAGIISAIAPDDESFAARLESISQTFKRFHGTEDRISVGFGPHSVYDLGPERLALVAHAASQAGAGVHVHLEETQAERQQVIDAHGVTATQLLHDAGVFENHTVAAHGVWLDDQDLSLLAAAGASVVHCPQSNLKLGSGIARVGAMLDAGVAVAIGTDGAASNDNLDLWEELRLTPLLARGSAQDPTAMTAATAFDLATRAGAAALGLEDVGELRPGAWADVVRLDLDHPAFAPGLEADLFNNLVWSAGSQHVTDVWVAGQRVVADREPTLVDRRGLQADAAHRAATLH